MDILTVKIDEEIINAFKHFEEWTNLSRIAEALRLTNTKTERICWTLVGKGIVLWKPGIGREQLFKYNKGNTRKKEIDILHKLNKLLDRNYYITGESALFLHGLTDHAMYQRIIDISLTKSKYNELAGKLVENLNKYATILPYKIPKQCNRTNIITDALENGYVLILRKSVHNIRRLKFHGDLNLPSMEISLEDADLLEKELFEYTIKAIDLGLADDEFEKLCRGKPDLFYLKKYLTGDENIPENILNTIQEAEKNVRGY